MFELDVLVYYSTPINAIQGTMKQKAKVCMQADLLVTIALPVKASKTATRWVLQTAWHNNTHVNDTIKWQVNPYPFPLKSNTVQQAEYRPTSTGVAESAHVRLRHSVPELQNSFQVDGGSVEVGP